jgi:general stress protein YciG
MDVAKQREIASKGGKAAHQKGTAHRFTAEEARVAGRKGGQVAHRKGTAHEFTPEEARMAGRKGGQAIRERSTARQRAAEPVRANGAMEANPPAASENNPAPMGVPDHRAEPFDPRMTCSTGLPAREEQAAVAGGF